MNEKRERGSVRSLERGFLILEYLAAHGNGTISEISRALDLPKSTAFYLLETMARRDYVKKDKDTGRFCLGTGLWRLAAGVVRSINIVEEITPWMNEAVKQTGETCKLAVRSGNEAVVVYKIDSPQSVRLTSELGAREPLHATAIGKCLMAWLPLEEIKEIANKTGLPRFTPRTITTLEGLLDELYSIRKQGFAIDDCEASCEGRCIAIPIRDHTGKVVAAMSVSGPSSRLSRDVLMGFRDLMLHISSEISKRITHLETPV